MSTSTILGYLPGWHKDHCLPTKQSHNFSPPFSGMIPVQTASEETHLARRFLKGRGVVKEPKNLQVAGLRCTVRAEGLGPSRVGNMMAQHT